MNLIDTFTPKGKEMVIQSKNSFSTSTKLVKTITYTKDDFVFLEEKRSSNFLRLENHNPIHADLPKIIQRRFWMHLHSKRQTYIVLENLYVNDECKWTVLFIETQLNEDNKTLNYKGVKEKPSEIAIIKTQALYDKLCTIEQTMGVDVAENYFERMLREEGKTYEQYMKDLCSSSNMIFKRRGSTKKLLSTRKKMKSTEVVTA